MTSRKVSIQGYDKEFVVEGDQTILEAGIHLPYACQSSSCGSCIVELKEGKVAMDHSGGLSRKEIADGYILPCCSKPETDLIIDLGV